MSSLEPVMSSTFVVAQRPVASGVHENEHWPPMEKSRPGEGSVGMTWARARAREAARTAIVDSILCVRVGGRASWSGGWREEDKDRSAAKTLGAVQQTMPFLSHIPLPFIPKTLLVHYETERQSAVRASSAVTVCFSMHPIDSRVGRVAITTTPEHIGTGSVQRECTRGTAQFKSHSSQVFPVHSCEHRGCQVSWQSCSRRFCRRSWVGAYSRP